MRQATRIAVVLAAWAALAAFGGCQLPLAMMEKMFPHERIPPKYKLPPGQKLLVFPDDMENPITYSPVKRVVAEKTGEILKKNGLAGEVLPYDKLVDLQTSEPEYNRMAVASIGRKLGADLVIYILLDQFTLKDTPEDSLWTGVFAARVRVVDVTKGRLWPEESAGFPVRVAEPETHRVSEAYGEELAKRMGERLAAEVAGLFHEHYVERSRPREEHTPSQE